MCLIFHPNFWKHDYDAECLALGAIEYGKDRKREAEQIKYKLRSEHLGHKKTESITRKRNLSYIGAGLLTLTTLFTGIGYLHHSNLEKISKQENTNNQKENSKNSKNLYGTLFLSSILGAGALSYKGAEYNWKLNGFCNEMEKFSKEFEHFIKSKNKGIFVQGDDPTFPLYLKEKFFKKIN